MKAPKIKHKAETTVLYCLGVEKELVDWLRDEAKSLGYTRLHEYLNILIRKLKKSSDEDAA